MSNIEKAMSEGRDAYDMLNEYKRILDEFDFIDMTGDILQQVKDIIPTLLLDSIETDTIRNGFMEQVIYTSKDFNPKKYLNSLEDGIKCEINKIEKYLGLDDGGERDRNDERELLDAIGASSFPF